MITSIFLDTVLPVIPGMKTLDDFIVKNYYSDVPVSADWISGYYWDQVNPRIAANSINPASSGVVIGAPIRNADSVTFSPSAYIDTQMKMPAKLTVAMTFKRPATNPAFVFSDYSGTGSTATGFAIGISSSGGVAAFQDSGAAVIPVPAGIAVGDMLGVTAYIRDTTISVSVYNPATDTIITGYGNPPVARTAGTRTALVGRKFDNNGANSVSARTLLVANGDIGPAANHLSVIKYLLAKH
ncbi:hypothetical protein [Klebsiella quasipneumoniae]|uniref:hypothetical protein n=1 Tax=Klebsiella quasipneumoniae TaxID=1463165 RepID=UPI00300705A7